MKFKLLFLSFFSITAMSLQGQAGMLDYLKPDHPRLLLDAGRVEELKSLAETDTLLAELIQIVHAYADSALLEPAIEYKFDEPGSVKLKAQRRASMFRVFNCGMTYLLTGDTIYAHRVKQDLLNAAAFPDWSPAHFLNIGELSAVSGIGYDWVYDYLTGEEREKIREGMIKNGLSQGLLAFAGTHQNGWWVNQASNWNQVCSGGMALSALAIAEFAPDTAIEILEGAISSIPGAMEGYMPEGAWMEGPTYWAFGTTYNGLFLSAMRSSMDSLFGMGQLAGYKALGKSGAYHIHTVGPSNRYFNFGDSKDILYYSPVLFWLSDEFNEDGYAWFERNIASNDLPRMKKGGLMDDDTLDRFLALLVAWYSEKGKDLSHDDFPLDAAFQGEGVAMGAFHSSWSKDGIYFGFKGGKPHAHHAHMDIGSFVMDAKGERWAMDLGYGNNSLPGYWDFENQRWDYLRNNNFSHNTLTMWGMLQNKDAWVPVSNFVSEADYARASLDMTGTYGSMVNSCVRNYWFSDRQNIEIIDEIDPKLPYLEVRWAMITPAEISLHGSEAILRQNGKEFRVAILEPEGAIFEELGTAPESHPDERPNEGTTMLAAFVEQEEDNPFKIRVELNPTDTILSGGETAIWESESLRSARLMNAYPNPFSNQVMFSFDLPAQATVRLELHNLAGQIIEQILDQTRPAGRNVIYYDGSHLNAGAYILKLGYADYWTTSVVVKE